MPAEQGVLGKWIRATAIGWLVGLVLVILLAMLWDAVGGNAQFMVGLGMGAGVGYFQSRLLNTWHIPKRSWLWTSIVGMSVPFILWDVSTAVGWNILSQMTTVLIGGLLVGIAQTMVLRPRSRRALWWIPTCVLGWGAPSGLIALGQLPGLWGIISIVTIFFGGLILGAVTGPVLVWMLRADPVSRSASSTVEPSAADSIG